MHVKFVTAHEVKICDRNTKIYPAGWSGEVDDKLAAAAIKAKKAEKVVLPEPAAPAPVKTDAGTPPPAK